MSKSLGNFFTVRDIGAKYDLQVLRFFMLSAHYRSPLNFSAELMDAAKSGLDRIITSVENLKFLQTSSSVKTLKEEEKIIVEEAKVYVSKFEEAMNEDFNTADAISAIFELVKFINLTVLVSNSVELLQILLDEVIVLSDICGLLVNKEDGLLDADIESLIQARKDARANKDFAKSDQIRDELLEKGILLEDTRDGVKWKRI